jgi:hypothetical protein
MSRKVRSMSNTIGPGKEKMLQRGANIPCVAKWRHGKLLFLKHLWISIARESQIAHKIAKYYRYFRPFIHAL